MSTADPATILIFDSGLGGLTVFREVLTARPDARFVYVADDAGFPYGNQPEDALIARIVTVIGKAIADHAPDLIVIACNTASTLALAELRKRYSVPFVGTVPAIKPACAQSASKRIAVLGTLATVSREYTRALIREFAADCEVDLVGSPRSGSRWREASLAGEPVDDAEIAREIAPCFVDKDGRRTDTVVLACTHYPLLLERFRKLAPWPVTWLDPAPAIARRVADLLRARPPAGAAPPPPRIVFTSGKTPPPKLKAALSSFGFLNAERVRLDLPRAAPDHVERDIEDDGEADIGDPAVPVEQPGDEARRHAHQHDRQAEPEHQRERMLARGARHRQHVVERHRDVRQHDLPGGLGEGLARHIRASPCVSAASVSSAFGPRSSRHIFQLHPEQQDAAGEQQADDRQQLDGDAGERDAQHRGGDDADQDGAPALLRRQAGGGEPDDDGIVAGQHQVDHDDLEEGGDRGLGEQIGEKIGHRGPLAGSISPTSQSRDCQRGPA